MIGLYQTSRLRQGRHSKEQANRMTTPHKYLVMALISAIAVSSCTNNPYRSGESAQSTLFNSFSTPPTKLDPATAYYSHEGEIIDQIYEPLFTYHYLKRPYELIPLTAEEVPKAIYYDKNGERLLDADPPATLVARAEYTIHVKRGIMYQNHPCFAKNIRGEPCYTNVTLDDIRDYDYPSEFNKQDTRELTARDYILQFRRLADPRLDSPIFSTLTRYVSGMSELHEAYKTSLDAERARRKAAAGASYNQEQDEKKNPLILDLMAEECDGMQVIDDFTLKIVLKQKYPQILYWMCMHFFGPVPQEALDFYNQPAMIEKQFVVNRCPVGTGPYYLKIFEPNKLMVLEQNPNYHEDYYPTEGTPGDREAGLLDDAGKRIPFIHKQVYRIEKESIPHWNKFLQGYVDGSGIANDVFDQAIQMQSGNDPALTDKMQSKGIRLATGVDTTFYYMQFNMLDEVVGGLTPERCKLRQAISIALDYNEYMEIFLNGRGILAQGPIPPGIFGYKEGEAGANPFVNEWDPVRKRHVRKPIETARQLMSEAGYPDGRLPDGKSLTLYYDHAAGLDPDFRSVFGWLSGRMERIGIKLRERGTELSRFREKRRTGNWQLSSSGWLADYPDPENFLFLLYGPNGLVNHGGVNACNYASDEYDRLFIEMETMIDSTNRQEVIDRAVTVLQRDCPAVWMFHPVSFSLLHGWYRNFKPHKMSYNTIKFRRIDPALRTHMQKEWNRPVVWPLALLVVLLIVGTVPAIVSTRRRERGR